jgi:acetylornithine deacetylase
MIAMRQAAPEAGVSIEITNEVPPFQADASSDIVPLALKLAQQNETFAVCYATEASLFQDGGAPAVVCGPGDIAQAHTPDEYLEVAELEKCLAFLARVAAWAGGA